MPTSLGDIDTVKPVKNVVKAATKHDTKKEGKGKGKINPWGVSMAKLEDAWDGSLE